MKMNYNSWFYKYHRYLTGVRNGTEGYNDTKWKNMNQRFQTLINLESSIMEEQPFGVVSNYKGFEKLIDLIDKSNYTFQDLNNALINTYKMSYENAMSRMLVNTHVVVSNCNNNDKRVVHQYKNNSKYYVVDVPYNQMHFGDRDEIIRQYLSEVYSRQTNFYMPMDRFISSNILAVLGFTFICTTNGLICNDWGVAIDDKGFHFKIGWGKGYDVNFIIYKIDIAKVIDINTTTSVVQKGLIPYDTSNCVFGDKCIINIFDNARKEFVRSIPNFGTIEKDGIKINGLQGKTITEITRFGVTDCRVIVYIPKFILELPNTYPAVNFCDMLYHHPITTENGDDVYTSDGKLVIGRTNDYNDDIPTCTPPICVDRSASTSFDVILDVVNMENQMLTYEKNFIDIGITINKGAVTPYEYKTYIIQPATNLLNSMNEFHKIYMEAGIITSLVTFQNQFVFNKFIERLARFVEEVSSQITSIGDFVTNSRSAMNSARSFSIDEFYGINYSELVKRVMRPFSIEQLGIFRKLDKTEFNRTYFGDYDKNTRITRPISEQCFMALKYSDDEECWVFTCPKIEHFHGIGNTFYIKKGLNGNEVFKFFILYSDTEDPMNKDIEPFDFETVVDFDKFCEEIDSYQAYIRYWNVENHLRKMSRILYNDDSTDKQFHVLSKMLLGKLSGEELLDDYPTDMNYEPSNATSDNINDYDETSDRAPFSVNFLFYTISMMYDNKDQLLSYFINKLTGDNFSNRYSDIDISEVSEGTIPVNFTSYSVAPTNGTYELPDEGLSIFYGIPNVYNTSGNPLVNSVYSYVFHRYPNNVEFPYVDIDSNINTEYHATYSGWDGVIHYDYDFEAYSIIMKYLQYLHDFMNTIKTKFTYSFSITTYLKIAFDKMTSYRIQLNQHYNTHKYSHTRVGDFVNDTITWINNVAEAVLEIRDYTEFIIKPWQTVTYNRKDTIYDYINKEFLRTLRTVYDYYGFDEFAQHRIKSLYSHMKKINSPMNLYEFHKWANEIDMHCIDELKNSFADNENNTPPPTGQFLQFSEMISAMIDSINSNVPVVHDMYESLPDVDELAYALYMMIVESSHDLYAIEKININSNTTSFASKPRYVVVNVTIPNDEGVDISTKLILVPFSEENGNSYRIKELNPICEYAFFGPDTIVPTGITVYDESGNQMSVDSLIVTISAMRVGSTSDISNDMYQLPNVTHSEFEFQNVHEYSTTVGNLAASYKIGNLNYELLCGNRFMPLTYEQELVLDRETMLPGPVDKVNIPNMTLNMFAKQEFGNHDSMKFYFKPVRVVHPEIIDGVLTSIGGKYHVGQTIYLKTNDEYEFTFPIIIRSIDHSIQHGFVEAIVDYNNANWLKVNDEDIERYMSEEIECVTIDDDISNFMSEFSHDYPIFQFTDPPTIDSEVTVYNLPGDPIYVQRNSDYVYTRLDWLFGTYIPNRFYDEDSKRYKFVYIGSGSIIQDDVMTINMINHDFNSMTLPEMYPVLREEPNDHFTYEKEQTLFKYKYDITKKKYEEELILQEKYQEEYNNAETDSDKLIWQLKLEDIDLKIAYDYAFMQRMEDYINQPESPTTWYNLYAYDDVITYIENGRAHMSHLPRFNIRDIVYTDNIEILMYDWENKVWLNPNDFTITSTILDDAMFDESDDYTTNDVQYTITITPSDSTFHSNKILIYFVYKTSDIYNDITLNPNTVNVRFKPTLSLYNKESEMYSEIRIRKHYDANEVYKIEEEYENDDFSLTNGYYVKRINRSGKYPDASIIRWGDLKVIEGHAEYIHTDFDIYERFPFPNVDSDQSTLRTTYRATIRESIDGFTPNETITLICLDSTRSDGNVSSLLFKARTSLTGTAPTITVVDSSMHYSPNGTFTCTVAKDPMYKSCGGIVTVTITNVADTQIMDANHKWYKVLNPEFKIVPDEFILVPKTITLTTPFTIEFHNHYTNPTSSISPYTYYYDTNHNVKYPISDIFRNKIEDRLEIDQTVNTNVKQIKSNYIGVCRYSIQHIPKDGLIDVTGYIPTPLSRKRYEFWVNGRCVTNTDKLIILSPTLIQLCNLTSLRNFELIELVDDIDTTNSVFPTGGVYMDLHGHTFSSYLLALISNSNIRYQNIHYRFYWNTKSDLDEYKKDIIKNPNNDDIETDILSYISNTETITSYNELFNIPSLNGVPLYHPTTIDLGISEIPDEKIIETYDKTWRYEMLMDPLFPMSHRDLVSDSQYVKFKIHEIDNGFRITTVGQCSKFFTLYITTNPSAPISSTYTKKIIPMMTLGTEIIIDEEYRGMCICSTFRNTTPSRI